MNYQEAVKFIKETDGKQYVVTVNGKKLRLRLFTVDNMVCEYGKGMRNRGHYISETTVGNWDSISLPVKKTHLESLRKNITKCIKYLDASELWSNINNTLKIFSGYDDDKLNEIISYDYDKFNKFIQTNNLRLSYDEFWSIIDGKIKTINYESWEKTLISKNFADAIANKTKFSWRWTKGYDNSIECRYFEDGIMRAWYSEEYRGCGNGHYYIALDATHALFVEND